MGQADLKESGQTFGEPVEDRSGGGWHLDPHRASRRAGRDESDGPAVLRQEIPDPIGPFHQADAALPVVGQAQVLEGVAASAGDRCRSDRWEIVRRTPGSGRRWGWRSPPDRPRGPRQSPGPAGSCPHRDGPTSPITIPGSSNSARAIPSRLVSSSEASWMLRESGNRSISMRGPSFDRSGSDRTHAVGSGGSPRRCVDSNRERR